MQFKYRAGHALKKRNLFTQCHYIKHLLAHPKSKLDSCMPMQCPALFEYHAKANLALNFINIYQINFIIL